MNRFVLFFGVLMLMGTIIGCDGSMGSGQGADPANQPSEVKEYEARREAERAAKKLPAKPAAKPANSQMEPGAR